MKLRFSGANFLKIQFKNRFEIDLPPLPGRESCSPNISQFSVIYVLKGDWDKQMAMSKSAQNLKFGKDVRFHGRTHSSKNKTRENTDISAIYREDMSQRGVIE